jgi:hypothetical protein
MNWKQLHALSTPEERLEAITLMLRVLHARRQRLVFAYGRLILDRRRAQAAHWISDRRGRINHSRAVMLTAFIFTLSTVSTATWLFLLHAPIQLAASALLAHLALLAALLIITPLHTLKKRSLQA